MKQYKKLFNLIKEIILEDGMVSFYLNLLVKHEQKSSQIVPM